MKCGKGHNHETIAEVRACYGVERPVYTREGQSEAWRDLPPKDRQMEMLARLRKQTGQAAKFTGTITRGQASDEIGELIELSKRQRAIPKEAADALAAGKPPWNDAERHSSDPAWTSADGDPEGYGDPVGHGITPEEDRILRGAYGPDEPIPVPEGERLRMPGHGSGLESGPVRTATRPRAKYWPDIPEGWYATTGHANTEIDFWHVSTPSEGRWAGYIFVKRVIGGQGPQRIRWPEQAVALEAVRKAGPAESMGLFGRKLRKCGKCHRPLTRKASRELGIGPDCAGQMGLGAQWNALDKKYGGA